MAAFWAGCSLMGMRVEPPRITLANINVREMKVLETVMEVELRVFNTNDFPFEIKGIDCELELNGRRLATGVSKIAAKIPAFDTGTATVIVYSSVLGVASTLLEMVRKAGEAEKGKGLSDAKLEYEISGRLHIAGSAVLARIIPFKAAGKLSLDAVSGLAK